jgi:hypothetical protein
VEADSPHIEATLNCLVAPISKVAKALRVSYAAAVESEMLNALAVAFEKFRVD